MYCINLTTTQAVELNELLQWYISSGHKAFSWIRISEIQEQIDYQLWDTMDDAELWDMYVQAIGMEQVREHYMNYVPIDREVMIETIRG